MCETFWNEESAGLAESKVGSTESKEKEVVEEAALLPPRSWGRRERRVWWGCVGVWGAFLCVCVGGGKSHLDSPRVY